MSPTAKLLVASFEVNVSAIELSFDVSPSDTVDDVMAIVGEMLSYVQLNWDAAVLPFEAPSVNTPALTSTVVAPSLLGVNVAV